MAWNLLANGFSPSNICCFFLHLLSIGKPWQRVCVFALEIDSLFEFNPIHSIGKMFVAIAIYFRISLHRLRSVFRNAQTQTDTCYANTYSRVFSRLFFILANKISLKQFSEWIELNTHCVTHWWSSWIIRNANRSKQMKMRQRGGSLNKAHWCWLLYVRLHCWL